MNKTSLLGAMSSVKSKDMIPVVVPFVIDACDTINLLWEYRCEFGSMYIKEPSSEVFIEDKHFKFFALGRASDPKEFVQRMAGLVCSGFIIDSGVLELAGAQAGYLLSGLQCRVRTPPPEKPFNFIFV